MADEKEEPKIPVFTVLKNGAILKNIFIVNKPPPPPHSEPIATVHQETEEILIVGRHPDCHIVLTHPSVSRFHLQILTNPSSQKLSLTDLSSVHGTWISEKRIEPGVRFELRQGDTLRVGASSRLYRLHWIPLSKAYEQDALKVLNCSPVDKAEADLESLFSDENMGLVGAKEESPALNQGSESEECVEDSSKDDCEEKEMYETPEVNQVVNALPIENLEFESTELVSEVIESLVCDDNVGFVGVKEIPSAPPMPEEEEHSQHGGENAVVVGVETQLSSFWAFGTESLNLFYPPDDCASESKENQYLQVNCVTGGSELDNEPESSSFNEKGEASPTVQVVEKDQGQSDICGLSAGPFVIESPSLQIREILAETKYEQVEEENLTPETKSDLLVNLDGKSSITEDYGQTDQLHLAVAHEYSDDKEEVAYAAAQVLAETAERSSLSTDLGQTDNDLCLSAGPFVMENSSLLVGEVGEINNQPGEEDNPAQKPTLLVNLEFEISNDIRCLVDGRRGETEKRSVSPQTHHEKSDTKTMSSVPLATDSVDSFSPDEVLSEIIDNKENQTLQSICTAGGQPESEFCNSPPLRSEDKSIFAESIWTRRGKPASAVLLQTERNRERATVEAGIDSQEVEIFTPDKENLTPNARHFRALKKKNEIEIKMDDTQEEEEIFTPNKENFTPNTLRLRSLKKKGKLEFTNSKSHKSSLSNQKLTSNIPREDLLVSTGKENQKLKGLQERKSVETTYGNQVRLEKGLMLTKIGTERMPFQSLLESSAGKSSRSEASVYYVATKSSTSLACNRTTEKQHFIPNKVVGEGKRGWTMVADTNTLLDKESRKSLQLLQGLKGTHLIIPRMVIRELDCMKQHGSLFRKKTEACLVLEWIEDCMVKSNWWIHVQSSLEDGRLIAPTPPAFPQSPFSGNSWGLTSGTTSLFPFLRCMSSMELASPAAEDHILDCALLHRKMGNEGQLVLLSNDISLKIKAMAEGLICETAQEFHESLVNPSSERFLWAGSCPRGRTWSYLADAALTEKYNRCQLKKSSKGEGAKGLKLILLHNSHYGHIH